MGLRRWTDGERATLARNYPLHRADVSLWDEPIDRSGRAIQDMASKMGVRAVMRPPVVSDADARRLMAVWRRACEAIGIDEDDAYAVLTLRRVP